MPTLVRVFEPRTPESASVLRDSEIEFGRGIATDELALVTEVVIN
jgi:hypothetical protein